MPLACPRCAVPLGAVRASPHAGGAAVELEHCDRCAGLWIDGPEIAAICPTLADFPAQRRLEITLLGKPGGGIARCPRCDQVPYEFVVIDIPVDFCGACGGVWLDGGEYGEIPFEGRPADAPRAGPYRESAARALSPGGVTCAGCGARAPIRSTYMSEWGLLCATCHAGRLQRAADRRAERAEPSGDLAEAVMLFLRQHWLR